MRARILVPTVMSALVTINGYLAPPAWAARSSADGVALSQAPAGRASAVSGAAPVLDPISDMSANTGGTADQAIRATDADGDPVSFFKSSGPTFMSVTTTDPGSGIAMGNIHVAPGAAEAGMYNAAVGATDGQFTAQGAFQITAVLVDNPPVLDQPADMTLQVDEVQDQQLTATDPDGDPLGFSKMAGPGYVSVTTTDPGAGTAHGNVHAAPTSFDLGTAAVTVLVDDGTYTDQKSFQITVTQDHPPVLQSLYDMVVRAENTNSQTLYAYDSDGDPLGFSKAAGPDYMSVRTDSPGPGSAYGTVTLSPMMPDVGTASGTVRVSDGFLDDQKTFGITVNPADRPPVLTQPDDMTVTESQILTQTITATDPDNDYLYFYKSGGPTYMTVSSGSGYGTVTGYVRLAPTSFDIGMATGSITAYANGLTDTKSFAITVVQGDFPPPCVGGSFVDLNRFYGYGLIEAQTADLNGDRILDLLLEIPGSGRASTAMGLGDGTFGDAVDLDAGTSPVSGAIGDWNRDDVPDLAVLDNSGGGHLHIFLGDGSGAFGPVHSYPVGTARSLVAADIDHDGDLDLILANPNTSAIEIVRGGGDGTFGPPLSIPAGPAAGAVVAPDLNGDGAPDVVVANAGDFSISVYLNDGNGTFGPRIDYPIGSYSYGVASADIDENGTMDVVVTLSGTSSFLVLPGDNTGGFGAPKEFSTGYSPRQVAVADWNGDGHLDIATANLGDDTVTMVLGDGTGSFGSRVDISSADGPYGIVTGDFDDDLRPDFAITNYYAGAITTYLNRCAPERDHPPIVKAPVKVSGAEGSLVSFNVTATDPDGPTLAALAMDASALPLGNNATFVTSPDLAQGTFTWTPDYQASRATPWVVRFIGSNDLADTATTKITVLDTNRPPTASAGGPYTAFVGSPVAFDGSASSDPDGDALAYAWVFGDGKTGVGAKPMHAYAATGVYGVALTVSDGTATALATTTVEVAGIFEARAFTTGGNRNIRLSSGKPEWCVELEPVGRSYDNVTVDLTSIVMKSEGTGSVSEIHASADKLVASGDHDGNGVQEIAACFTKADLRAIFSALHGKTTATVSFEGSLYTGGVFRAQMDVAVIASGGTLAASISPNPLNPDAVLTFRTERDGPVRIEIFDLNGRLVFRLMEESNLAAGYHDVRVPSRREGGGALASGVYFFRIEALEGRQTGRFTVLK